MELKTYKEKVASVLEQYEKARNSDSYLFAQYVNKYHANLVTQDINGDKCVPLKNFEHLPAIENIRRNRQIIQNHDNLYPPTDPEVIKARGIKEKNWREVEVREAKQTTLL